MAQSVTVIEEEVEAETGLGCQVHESENANLCPPAEIMASARSIRLIEVDKHR
jgi:hypothetical protein